MKPAHTLSRRALGLAALGLAALGVAPALHAQAPAGYPSRPVMLLVPTAAGGTTDIAARMLGVPLSAALGQTVVVDNKGGGNGNIGTALVARAKPDGYTLLMQYSGYHVITPLVSKQAPQWEAKDFVPVANVLSAPQIVVVRADLPFKTMGELVAYAKAHPGKINCASSGNGSLQHATGAMLEQQAGIQLTHIPYKGTGPALQDLLGGQVDIMFDSLLTSLPLIKGGKLRPYAVAGKSRSRYFPDVPTMAELGYPEIQFPGQVSFYGSSKLPPEVLAKLQAAIQKAAQAPAVQQKLLDLGLEPDVSVDSPAMLAETKALFHRNAAIVKKFDIQPN